MKKTLAVFGLGVSLPLLLALYLGGENLTQAGIRLTAIEQGFSLACRHWQFEATPAHEDAVAMVHDGNDWFPDPAPMKPAKRGRK